MVPFVMIVQLWETCLDHFERKDKPSAVSH